MGEFLLEQMDLQREKLTIFGVVSETKSTANFSRAFTDVFIFYF